MSFTSYSTIADVARTYRITLREVDFLDGEDRLPSETLRQQLNFTKEFANYRISEWAICENVIHPILQDEWKAHTNELMLWSHIPLDFDADLSGIPDYMVTRISLLGRYIVEPPYLIVVEAKRDDSLIKAWAQCLAAMLAAQKLHNLPELTLYGITTNGPYWQFGKLEGSTFIQDTRFFTVTHLDELCGAVHFVFEQCRSQILRLPRSA